MKYTLRQLQIFAQTAKLGNISRAAETLALSQSAASNALKELENQFDIQLFDRIGKRLKLNPLGESIRPLVEELLEQAQALEAQLSQSPPKTHLKLGATLTIGNYLVANLMAAYLKAHGDVSLDLQVANTQAIVDKVLKFELDMALIEGEANHPDLLIEEWQQDRLVVFAAPSHPLTQQKKVSRNDLLKHEWILREQGSGTRQIFERNLASQFNQLNILLELSQTQAIKQAVKSGLGVGCLSEIVLAESFANGSLVPIKVQNLNLSRRLYTVIHKKKHLNKAMQAWLATVKNA